MKREMPLDVYKRQVEGELGRLAGVEDDVNVSAADSSYTDPAQVEAVSYTHLDVYKRQLQGIAACAFCSHP